MKNRAFANYVLTMTSFLVGHSVAEALEIDPNLCSTYAVILVVVAVLGVASWALPDPNQDLKEFGWKLGAAVVGALATGFVGYVIGAGVGLIAITVLVLITIGAWLIRYYRQRQANT